MKLSIQNKLLLPTVSIVIVVMSASIMYIYALVKQQLTENFEQELNIVSVAVSKTVQNIAVKYKTDIESDVAKALQLFQLPPVNTPEAVIPYNWEQAPAVPADVLERAVPLRIDPLQPADEAAGKRIHRA